MLAKQIAFHFTTIADESFQQVQTIRRAQRRSLTLKYIGDQ